METAAPANLFADAWAELRRRKVVRAGATYALVAWVVLQLGEITFEPLGLPERALTWTILAAILGFPLVLVISWFYDLGPHGLTRDRSRASRAGAVSAIALVLITVGASAYWLAQVYAPVTDAQALLTATPPDTSASQAPPNSIAVLPFKDMSPATDQAHLADGIAEELLDRLARIPQLRVAARTSSFAVVEADVKEIGRLLDVRWVLEGSVRKSGGRLRITAQLIDASNGYHQWSETYDREEGDLFALQDEVSIAIVEQLSVLIPNATPADAQASEGDSNDPIAHEAFLRGRQLWRQRTPASLDEAETLLRQAVQRDPQFAKAWAALADTLLLQADYGRRPVSEAIELAEPAAVRAVTLAPRLGEAWASVGLLRLSAGQLPAAERSLRQAIALDPRYEMAPTWLAVVLGRTGQNEEKEKVLRQALQLNPLEPVTNSNLANALAERGLFDEAEAQLQNVLAVTPKDALLLRSLAELQGNRGELAQSLASARAAHATDPAAPANIRTLVLALIRLRALDEAQRHVESLPEASDARLELLQLISLYGERPQWLDALRRRVIDVDPAARPNLAGLFKLSAWASIVTGHQDQALALLRQVPLPEEPRSAHDLEDASLLAALDAEEQLGDAQARARWRARTLDTNETKSAHFAGNVTTASIHAMLGEHETALQLLQLAVEGGFTDAAILRVDPRWRGLQDAPAFRDALAQMDANLAEQRRKAGLEAPTP